MSDHGTETKVGMKPVVHVHACTCIVDVHVQHYVGCMFWDKVSTLDL